MKKTLFALCAVLLALLTAACSNPGGPDSSNDGLVNVSISTGNVTGARALTTPLAKGGVDYYEVAFLSGDRVYRASWDYTKTGRIAVPAGDYFGASKAILFAGRYSNRTLLAVGILTKIDSTNVTATGTGTGSATISPNTSSVTFTLSALTNDVKPSTSSTFKITGPTTPFDYQTSTILGDFPTAEINGVTYPLFRIPKNSADTTATYKVNIPLISVATFDQPTNTGIIINDNPGIAPKLPSTGFYYETDYGVTVKGGTTPISPISGAVPANGEFTLSIDTTGLETGLSQLSIEVPVCAIDKTNDSPGTWYIRGGMSQNILDAGVGVSGAQDSLGGAVLLGVGAVQSSGFQIDTELITYVTQKQAK